MKLKENIKKELKKKKVVLDFQKTQVDKHALKMGEQDIENK